MDHFSRLVNRIGTVSSIIGIVFMLAIAVGVVINVILRGFFNTAVLGTYEAVQIMMVVVASFGIGYCAIKQGHISVDIITNRFSQRVQAILAVCINFLSLVIWSIIAWKSVEYAFSMVVVAEKTAIMQWPVTPMRYIFVLGVVILLMKLVIDLVNSFRISLKD